MSDWKWYGHPAMKRLWVVLLLLGCGEPEHADLQLDTVTVATPADSDGGGVPDRYERKLTPAEDSVLREYWRGYDRGEMVQRVRDDG